MHGQARVRERTLELQKLRQFGRGRLAPYVSRRFDVSEPRERLPNLRVKKIAQVDKVGVFDAGTSSYPRMYENPEAVYLDTTTDL